MAPFSLGALAGLVFSFLLPLLSRAADPTSAAAPRVTLDIPIFAGGYGTAFYEETAREFERLRPEVRVNIYGDPRISDKLRVRIIDGQLPDAMLPFNVLIPALVDSGRLRDLAPHLAAPNWENDAAWGDSFLPGALDAWRICGGTYGVPLSYACWTIYYNRALFRAHGWTEPRTWDEFFVLCEKIRATGLAPVSLTGIYGNYPDAFLRAAYYNLAGADAWRALNALAPGARTDPRYVRAAAVLQRITQHHTLAGWEGATHTAAQTAFLEGRAAMCVSGSWMIYEMGARIPADFEIGVMNFPVFPDGVADPRTIQTGADYFFAFATGDAEREALTVEFLRFLTSRSRAAAWVRRVDAPVAVRGVPLEAFSPRMRPIAEMIAQAPESFNMPQVMLQTPGVRQALVDHRLALMGGRITPEEFGARIEAAAAHDRARAENPDAIDIKHPFAGTALLTALAAIAVWLILQRTKKKFRANEAWRTESSKPAMEESADGTPAGFGDPALQPSQRAALPSASGMGDATALPDALEKIPAPAATRPRLRPVAALGFVGPAFFLYVALVLVPGVVALGWAFTQWDGMGAREWVGWLNFKALLFESDVFWAALRNNAFLMLVPAVVVLPLALALAYVLHRGIWGAGVFRAVLLFPNLLGGIAAALLWMTAYEPHGGLVNAGLVALGDALGSDWLRSFAGYPWLAPRQLYWAIVPIYVWMACGFNLVLYLAAMEGINPELYEAAELEGASRARQFFSITLPLIWEVVVVSAVFIVIAGLNAFELVWLLTQQDPDTSTHTLGTMMVTSMFKEFQIGRATAIAVLLFVLVLAGSAALMRGLRREEVES
ncbi:MAG: extracellular solute-binding protein [Candidatus Didemnitutus sp.]|nr:extracellular solute-binding protein [Candidatus Didemnitutus sp.]